MRNREQIIDTKLYKLQQMDQIEFQFSGGSTIVLENVRETEKKVLWILSDARKVNKMVPKNKGKTKKIIYAKKF